MFKETEHPTVLRPEELEAVYAISRAVASAVNMDSALDEIIRLARPVFIFDNMVLYLKHSRDTLEPSYARAIGRGRFHEAELAWGETIANEALLKNQVVLRLEEDKNETDRMRLRYSIGLPLRLEMDATGALVFIRFGGPQFKPDQIRLSEFIAAHVAQLLDHDHLVQHIASLEAERRLNRLQEDFIATVSHELLTPLGFIKGYATTLLRSDTTWDDDTRKEFLSIIDEEADRLHELIENLMDSSRLQAGTLKMDYQPLRLDAFLKDMLMRATSRQENVHIHMELDSQNLQISGDPTRLAQVFDNLLTNAGKYAPDSPITISLTDQGTAAHISVKDCGPGIAPEHLAHLFKRFYRVPTQNTNVRGTGLGLFICRQIIRAHGGEIWVESKVGEGTTFHIRLPYHQVQSQNQISLRENIL